MSTTDFDHQLSSLSGPLHTFAYKLTKNNEEAKDLYQETAFRAISNIDKFIPGTNLKAWLLTIMKNIFINNYRRKVKQNTIFDHTSNDYLLDYNQGAVANRAEANLGVKEIYRSIDKLPDIFKRPFLMYFDGYKYYEIADMLREPLGTIKSRIHFARKMLKAQVSKY